MLKAQTDWPTLGAVWYHKHNVNGKFIAKRKHWNPTRGGSLNDDTVNWRDRCILIFTFLNSSGEDKASWTEWQQALPAFGLSSSAWARFCYRLYLVLHRRSINVHYRYIRMAAIWVSKTANSRSKHVQHRWKHVYLSISIQSVAFWYTAFYTTLSFVNLRNNKTLATQAHALTRTRYILQPKRNNFTPKGTSHYWIISPCVISLSGLLPSTCTCKGQWSYSTSRVPDYTAQKPWEPEISPMCDVLYA